MNELMYDLTERCKGMTIKSFKDYAKLWREDTFRLMRRNKLSNEQTAECLVEWLDYRIRMLIKYKKRADKILNDYKAQWNDRI